MISATPISSRPRSLALLVFLSLSVGSAHAQEAGLWGAFGVASGSFGCLGSPGCDARSAIGGFAALAKVVTPRLSAGVELNGFVKDKGETTVRMGTAIGVIFLRPAVHSGLRLKGGLGVSAFRNTGTIYGDIILDDHRFGVLAALGAAYDIRLSPNMSVSPTFTFGSAQFFPGSHAIWHLGVGLTWH